VAGSRIALAGASKVPPDGLRKTRNATPKACSAAAAAPDTVMVMSVRPV